MSTKKVRKPINKKNLKFLIIRLDQLNRRRKECKLKKKTTTTFSNTIWERNHLIIYFRSKCFRLRKRNERKLLVKQQRLFFLLFLFCFLHFIFGSFFVYFYLEQCWFSSTHMFLISLIGSKCNNKNRNFVFFL